MRGRRAIGPGALGPLSGAASPYKSGILGVGASHRKSLTVLKVRLYHASILQKRLQARLLALRTPYNGSFFA